MKSAEIRRAFLDFFAAEGHTVVPGSALIPADDPTLLFTNAGMVQFKNLFTGRETRSYQQAVSAQRCVRAGGKHNDLENVGYTARHHTFFEMLGNFSFGAYSKAEAIRLAWALLTQTFQIPASRLWVTVHDSDAEAERIWVEEIGVSAERVLRLGDQDNFWAMGETGPCGPCSEIYYDHGPAVGGGLPGTPEADGDRYTEVWNLVFMQYERGADGTLTELPRPCVDTGMGLERMAAVLQGVCSNYDIDLFRNLIRAAAEALGVSPDEAAHAPSLRVLADHIRSASFLIADGVVPGNEGRGYVLRRIIRRALRHGHKLGCRGPFFHQLVASLVAEMGDAYPELARRQAYVEQVLAQEEDQFNRALTTGLVVFEEEVAKLAGTVIPGDVAFRLYDTYGFPLDLTADAARERGLAIDEEGFAVAMAQQQARARAASRFGAVDEQGLSVAQATEFTGYERDQVSASVLALFRLVEGREAEAVERLAAAEAGVVVLDRTAFYAEAGGQIGDTGEISSAAGGCFQVTDTRLGGAAHLHQGRVAAGGLRVGEEVSARIDSDRRRCIARNHSATHLLHAALRETLGEQVEQKGSLVAADRLRFDFSHPQAVTAAELAAIEHSVNAQIWRDSEVTTELMDFSSAQARGAVALFGQKYGDEVRVLGMGHDFSVELCGGTHVSRTGEIGLLRIVAEQGIASGIRRIEAVTGPGVLALLDEMAAIFDRLAVDLKTGRNEPARGLAQAVPMLGASRSPASCSALAGRLATRMDKSRSLEKQLEALQQQVAAAHYGELVAAAVPVAGVQVLAVELASTDPKSLLTALDELKKRLGCAVVVLATVHAGKVALIASVAPELTDWVHAGDLLRHVGACTGARGGGRPELARAGGGDKPEALAEALRTVVPLVKASLAGMRPRKPRR